MSTRSYADSELEQRRLAALAQVRQLGDPALRTPALPVTEFDETLRNEIARMKAIMADARGVGLAAPQIGALRRLVVVLPGEDAEARALVNPRISWASEEQETDVEGCLSIGEIIVEVPRAVSVRVEAQDADGTAITHEASGFEARVIQHEIDHLDGILILDRTTKEQRREALRALRDPAS